MYGVRMAPEWRDIDGNKETVGRTEYIANGLTSEPSAYTYEVYLEIRQDTTRILIPTNAGKAACLLERRRREDKLESDKKSPGRARERPGTCPARRIVRDANPILNCGGRETRRKAVLAKPALS
ncbi:hypothetical protein K438DRAFT_1757837 [Mycena galopus ATCC 62051]|nr:hypothetical protein K438DRAFT_1757837 [Mycena galopus ATCC 62051]